MRFMARALAGAGLIAALAAIPTASATSPSVFFFDSASARLSPQAEAIIAVAASTILTEEAREVELLAATDRVGSAASNLRLSRRRGEAVKAALVDRGVPAGVIRISAYGENRSIVETADEVPEPQNRYVWIAVSQCRTPPDATFETAC